ncbi:glycosyltransferase [Poseidonibacter ostreae]|jgi:glycosyltransferase involved in cell wall biosynthesis|uniref:Glycosyltransferase n=1 Tax=Poseidonibacter ostreae TaxID=2654171 RepID=A0A6L4WUW4_9BACT|nr:glycosyltransferase [Poseidonibacter ostreae]KAB7886169.1 glycosyltransferase [Poseidonibacter ostreae]KAB7888585.1 glycosyltransferase [Poseidonibacter ostreae]KAB7890401.1 glycosyltransferase [Poseidonibacter ostreae]
MNKITISYKSKTNLIKELEKDERISVLEKQSLFKKLSFSKKEYADIYFHSGVLDDTSILNIKNAKKTIVNCKKQKNDILEKIDILDEKVKVIYPSIKLNYQKPKKIKEKICKEFDIDSTPKIIYFTANNLKTSGVKEFFDIIVSLNSMNKQIIISSDKNQITSLKFLISKYNFGDEVLLLEDYKNENELFLAADIFLLPTNNKSFATNVLKAMYFKCAVLTPTSNPASELIDVFATMENPSDPSTSFKLDALLSRPEDLKLIQKANRKIAKKYELLKNMNKLNRVLDNI